MGSVPDYLAGAKEAHPPLRRIAMLDRSPVRGAALGGTLVVSLLASIAAAQPPRRFVERLPLPPAEGYQVQRVFDLHRFETGENWLELPIADYGVGGTSSEDANNFAYVRVVLTGRPGKMYVNSGWDNNGTPIDQPKKLPDGRWGDDCAHSHHVGAAYWLLDAPRLTGYFLIGSHAALGMRFDSNWVEQEYGIPAGYTCGVTTQLSHLHRDQNIFRWGTGEYTINVDPLYTKEVILAAQSPTHGTGNCPEFECFPPAYIIVAQIE
jgi:hypothetical protein